MIKGLVKRFVFLLAFMFFFLAGQGWLTFVYFGGGEHYIAKYNNPYECNEAPRNDWMTAAELQEKYPEIAAQLQQEHQETKQIALPSSLSPEKTKIQIKP